MTCWENQRKHRKFSNEEYIWTFIEHCQVLFPVQCRVRVPVPAHRNLWWSGGKATVHGIGRNHRRRAGLGRWQNPTDLGDSHGDWSMFIQCLSMYHIYIYIYYVSRFNPLRCYKWELGTPPIIAIYNCIPPTNPRCCSYLHQLSYRGGVHRVYVYKIVHMN